MSRRETQIALLRGINVGGHKRVPMAALRELLESHGFDNVKTLLNSGNVVLDSLVRPKETKDVIAKAIVGRFGLDVKIMVRASADLARVVAANPIPAGDEMPSRYMVLFLSQEPVATLLEVVSVTDFAPEQFVIHGREIYALCPAGINDSPMLKALSDKKLGVDVTARNWNTVLKLRALTKSS